MQEDKDYYDRKNYKKKKHEHSLSQEKKKKHKEHKESKYYLHERDYSRSRNKSKYRDHEHKEKYQTKEKDKDNIKEKYQEKHPQKHTEKSKQGKQKYQAKDRHHGKEKHQEWDRKDSKYEKESKQKRHDKQKNWKSKERNRSHRQYLYDSPPKSDESDISDDPQKMDRLNRTKAEQELVTSKADRKLYLGNLPPNITSQQLMQTLNVALKKMEINCQTQGDSIISAWISPDGVGHYAFVEFRTAQEATNGLTLNGASLYGYQLKLGRPKQYIEYNKQLLSEYGTDSNIDTIIKKVKAMGSQEPLKIIEKIVTPPSRVIILKHIVTIQELAIDEEYTEIQEDIMDMAKRFGDVVKMVIPRPHQVIDLHHVQKRVKGLGYVFIEYKNVEQAKLARKEFLKKMFSERSVACSYFPEDRFKEGQLDIMEKVVIDF